MREITPANLSDGVISLREIAWTDSELLYTWRFQAGTREVFRSQEVAPFESHQRLLERYFESDSRDRWFLIEAAGEPVGTVSLYNFSEDGWCEWGRFVVSPRARGKGYGRRALRLVLDYAHSIGIRHLRCEVLSTNLPALRLYASLGFMKVCESDHHGRMFLTLKLDLAKLA